MSRDRDRIREIVISGGKVVPPASARADPSPTPSEASPPTRPDGRVRIVAVNVFRRARFVIRARSLESARALLAPHDPCGAMTLIEDPRGEIDAGDVPELVEGGPTDAHD